MDKLYAERKKIMDKYFITNQASKEYEETVEQLKKFKTELPSKGEVDKSLYEWIAEYEKDIAENTSNRSIENKALFEKAENKEQSLGLLQIIHDKSTWLDTLTRAL